MNWGWPFSYMQDIDQKTSQPVDVGAVWYDCIKEIRGLCVRVSTFS